MSGGQRVTGKTNEPSAREPRRCRLGTLRRISAETAGALSASDERRALAVVRKKGRQRRCVYCGHMFLRDELHPEFDEEERRIGWVCDGCY